MDPFFPPKDVETILLASSVKTRYLRIYPRGQLGNKGSVCLKFEIIGCQPVGEYNTTYIILIYANLLELKCYIHVLLVFRTIGSSCIAVNNR